MKKVLLLSAVASTMIFAGGDIAPVEPAAPATADFWGQVGFFYQAEDNEVFDWGDTENNRFSTTIVLGVEKDLGNGFGVGAEVAGWSDFGLDIADRSGLYAADGLANAMVDPTSAEVSQAYLTYSFGNTAIKAGRQALPKAVSPWAWSARTAGVLDITYDGVVVANTDIANTTLVAAWVDQASFTSDFLPNVDVSDDAGLFMLAMINKSLANTTLALSGYYVPSSNFNGQEDAWSIWGSAVGNVESVNWGLQVAYVDGDLAGTDATVGVAAKVGSKWGDLGAELVAGYINDGDYSLKTAGSGRGTSAFWTFNGDFGGDRVGDNVWSIMLKASYDLHENGKLFGNVEYFDADDNAGFDTATDVRVGYKFTVAGVNSQIEYRYLHREFNNGGNNDRQRVRVEAYYKF
jgi:hypothetical protein